MGQGVGCFAGRRGCSAIAHWNGRRWLTYGIPTQVATFDGSSRSNVWLIGESYPRKQGQYTTFRPAVFRFNGSVWTRVRLRVNRMAGTPALAVASRSNIVLGLAPTGHRRACAIRWNGTRWRQIGPNAPGGLPFSTPCQQITSDGRGGFWFGPFYHWSQGRLRHVAVVFPFEHGRAVSSAGMSGIPSSTATWLVGWLKRPGSPPTGFIAKFRR
jgi:hypothetical protein